MLSAMAQCRMQIEKCKIAFCQIGTLARLHVCTLERLLLTDLMFWHLDIWISFCIWILKFGFFRPYLNVCSFC